MQKSLKKILCWLMAAMLCAEAGTPTVRAEAAAVGETFQEDTLQYTVDETNAVTGIGRVTCTGPKDGLTEIHVPASVTHDGVEYEVWRIGKNAFGEILKHNSLATVTIAEGVTVIEERAFQSCERLVSISLPESLTEIGEAAFHGCLDLPSISLPGGITEIKDSTFWNCHSLTKVDIPDGVRHIGDAAFMNCRRLEDIQLPGSLESIGESAFAGCESLAEGITIPQKVPVISLLTFGSCESLPEITLWDTTKIQGQGVFSDCMKLGTLKIVVTSDPPVPLVVADPDGCFEGCPTDRRLVFLDGNGAELRGGALAAAQEAYRAVDDGDPTDGLWYGWKIGETPARPYAVTIKVNKDNQPWPESGKGFQLSRDGGNTYITDLAKVGDGTYRIYEITGTGPLDTGVDITVNGKDAEATVDYYTVGFYDGDTLYGMDTPQHPQVVLKGGRAVRPADPEKKGFIFKDWVTAKDGDVPFDFPTAGITAPTSVYAAWEKGAAIVYHITASAGEGGSISPEGAVEVYGGGDQPFTITPQEGYKIKEVLVDGQPQGAITSYTFTNVTEDHTISVSFQKKEDPGDTENPGEGEPGDTEKPGEGDPDDTEKPGEGDPGDTENPGEGDPGDTENPGEGDPGDTENPGEGDPDGPDGPGAGETPGGTDTPGDSQEDEGAGTPGEEDQTDGDDGNTGTASGGSGHTGRPGDPGAAQEPKTGDGAPVGVYATVAMVSGLLYTQLYFAGKKGMTKARKSELVSAIAGWAKKGGKCRRYAALAAIFFILVYYHSIGKCTEAEFGENMQAVK